MKTEIINKQSKTEINWSKPMLVKSKLGLVLLTTGNHLKSEFSGQVQIGNEYHGTGSYSTTWLKSSFTPVTEIIEIRYIP